MGVSIYDVIRENSDVKNVSLFFQFVVLFSMAVGAVSSILLFAFAGLLPRGVLIKFFAIFVFLVLLLLKSLKLFNYFHRKAFVLRETGQEVVTGKNEN